MQYLVENDVTRPCKNVIENSITAGKLGELNSLRNFLRDGVIATSIKSGNSKKCRADLFRRSLVRKELRERFDESKIITLKNVSLSVSVINCLLIVYPYPKGFKIFVFRFVLYRNIRCGIVNSGGEINHVND